MRGHYLPNPSVSYVGRLDAYKANASDWETSFGFGATYQINKQWGVRAEWERFNNLGDSDTGESDVDLLSVGAVFRF
jgi:hypothetical protein